MEERRSINICKIYVIRGNVLERECQFMQKFIVYITDNFIVKANNQAFCKHASSLNLVGFSLNLQMQLCIAN